MLLPKEMLEMTLNQIDLSPDSLKQVAKQVKIEAELNELKVKVEKLTVRSEIEDLDLSDEIEKLNKELIRLKTEKEKHQSKGEHPIFELVQKQTVLEERVKKLNKKKSQIQPAVYDSLKNEYSFVIRKRNWGLTKVLYWTYGRLTLSLLKTCNLTVNLFKLGIQLCFLGFVIILRNIASHVVKSKISE